MNKIIRYVSWIALFAIAANFIVQAIFNIYWIESIFGNETLASRAVYLVFAVFCFILAYDAYSRAKEAKAK